MYRSDRRKYAESILELRNALVKNINEHIREYQSLGISVKKITPPKMSVEDLKNIQF